MRQNLTCVRHFGDNMPIESVMCMGDATLRLFTLKVDLSNKQRPGTKYSVHQTLTQSDSYWCFIKLEIVMAFQKRSYRCSCLTHAFASAASQPPPFSCTETIPEPILERSGCSTGQGYEVSSTAAISQWNSVDRNHGLGNVNAADGHLRHCIPPPFPFELPTWQNTIPDENYGQSQGLATAGSATCSCTVPKSLESDYGWQRDSCTYEAISLGSFLDDPSNFAQKSNRIDQLGGWSGWLDNTVYTDQLSQPLDQAHGTSTDNGKSPVRVKHRHIDSV